MIHALNLIGFFSVSLFIGDIIDTLFNFDIASIYCLLIFLNPLVNNSVVHVVLQDMECELNVYWKELVEGVGWGNTLLAAQLFRLMACLDVFLESAGATGISPAEFPRDKIFFQPVRLVTIFFMFN